MMKRHKSETDEIMDIMFTMEDEFEERQNDARQEFQSLRDEIKNKVAIAMSFHHNIFII